MAIVSTHLSVGFVRKVYCSLGFWLFGLCKYEQFLFKEVKEGHSWQMCNTFLIDAVFLFITSGTSHFLCVKLACFLDVSSRSTQWLKNYGCFVFL